MNPIMMMKKETNSSKVAIRLDSSESKEPSNISSEELNNQNQLLTSLPTRNLHSNHENNPTKIISQPGLNENNLSGSIGLLSHLKDIITIKIMQLSKLNEDYEKKQEREFLNTFMSIMDNTSDQISQFKQKLRNIDQEISAMPECVQLREKKQFYQRETKSLNAQVEEQLRLTCQVKERNDKRQRNIRQLREKYENMMKKNYEYKSRKLSLETKINESLHKKSHSFITEEPQYWKKKNNNSNSNYNCNDNKNNQNNNNNAKIIPQSCRYSNNYRSLSNYSRLNHGEGKERKEFIVSQRDRQKQKWAKLSHGKLEKSVSPTKETHFDETILNQHQHSCRYGLETYRKKSLRDKRSRNVNWMKEQLNTFHQ